MDISLDDVSSAAIQVVKKTFELAERQTGLSPSQVAAITEELAAGLPVGRKYDPLERALTEIGKRATKRAKAKPAMQANGSILPSRETS